MTAQPAPGESPGPAFAVACMTAQRLHGRAALTRWVAHVVPGEVLGFSIAAGAGTAAWVLDAPITLLVLAVVAGGSIEGGCLGYAQARALLMPLQPEPWSCPRVRTGAGVAAHPPGRPGGPLGRRDCGGGRRRVGLRDDGRLTAGPRRPGVAVGRRVGARRASHPACYRWTAGVGTPWPCATGLALDRRQHRGVARCAPLDLPCGPLR